MCVFVVKNEQGDSGIAQLVEHLTFNQRVTGSSPVRLIFFAGVAELADALDLGSSALRRGGSSPFTRII